MALSSWTCKIGEFDRDLLPGGCDLPMRKAVEDAYEKLTGEESKFTFSGWGGKLNEYERAVVENREPVVTELKADRCPEWKWDVFVAGISVGILLNTLAYFFTVTPA